MQNFCESVCVLISLLPQAPNDDERITNNDMPQRICCDGHTFLQPMFTSGNPSAIVPTAPPLFSFIAMLIRDLAAIMFRATAAAVAVSFLAVVLAKYAAA
ncbi:hypothetical protein ASE07_11340 [Noviherbaspirillum sp. Root189]|nr:hypothetical protein ASE07_11340 [Noviherbaspirillum sp. Root189]